VFLTAMFRAAGELLAEAKWLMVDPASVAELNL
jgi:hypothetical protein